MRRKNTILGLLALSFLAGCDTLPASGPSSRDTMRKASIKSSVDVSSETSKLAFNYALLDVSKPIVKFLSAQEKEYAVSEEWPIKASPKDIRISVGDTIQVTIYESQSGGLFIPSEAGVRPGNFVSIPKQIIDKTGVIDIPFAGEIKVVGRTASSVGKEISEKLGERAIEPQAVVSILERNGSEVSVIGEVGDPKRFSLSLEGEKILDAIARAGGPSFPGYETFVSLQRKGKEWTIPFDALIQDPQNNIFLQPGDTVYLYKEPETFQMFGAAGFNGTHDFTKREMTIAEAIGEARGLKDNQADPAEIYLYRYEGRKNLDEMSFLELDVPDIEELKDTVPVIYRINLRKPDGYFLAQKFPVRDQDVVYIANAESVEFTKFLDLLNNTSITKIDAQQAIEQ